VKHLDAALACRAHKVGRAIRKSLFRHRRLANKPMAVVLWQLGAEPFSAAAIGWGERRGQPALSVAGEPRNRDLAFAAILPFARWFNPLFESHDEPRDTIISGSRETTLSATAPQVLVANRATVEMLGRLGRRLAYLPTEGPRPADPELVRLGRHLLFLWSRWATPGQQLLVSLTDLLNAHWVTPQSDLERQALAALDAYIEPPGNLHGFDAAAEAERHVAGPMPASEDDERLDPLVKAFNEARGERTDSTIVARLITSIEDHYRPLVRRTWDLIWRCRDRELRLAEAPSVGRRWDEDRRAYTAHMDWMAQGGLRRTRQSARQAAQTLRRLEDAKRRVEAEEACDDPLRMIPYILENKAVRGRVVKVDPDHREIAKVKAVRRPLVTLHSPDPCLMPPGKELWWTERPSGAEYVVHAIGPDPGGGASVTVKLMTSSAKAAMPVEGEVVCFSVLETSDRFGEPLPKDEPWTHRASTLNEPVMSIED
jgi:hypothetical protein